MDYWVNNGDPSYLDNEAEEKILRAYRNGIGVRKIIRLSLKKEDLVIGIINREVYGQRNYQDGSCFKADSRTMG